MIAGGVPWPTVFVDPWLRREEPAACPLDPPAVVDLVEAGQPAERRRAAA